MPTSTETLTAEEQNCPLCTRLAAALDWAMGHEDRTGKPDTIAFIMQARTEGEEIHRQYSHNHPITERSSFV